MSNDLLTPNAVVHRLADLSRELDQVVKLLKDAELDAVEKRHAADVCESRAFVSADGSMDLRKHTARLAAEGKEHDALVAEALVRHLRKSIDAIQTRIDIGRSMGASLRAELSALPYGDTP